ncbi:hypothetical protein C8A03DRAFT_37512 [Achaetomium macrosporum]|uniref:Uncharacterized protein n=1 Tax=Achaetomium macrosporum TaxID=79813 RepID=A0AAN7C3H2_9PEZI|nr:hypothetical protein C8A03DRAFT_37512 [Achaetomium macrosporum]
MVRKSLDEKKEAKQLECCIERKGEMEQLDCKANSAPPTMRKDEENEAEHLDSKRNIPQPHPAKSSPQKGWQFNRTAEFPWRLQQIVQEESNWRGTWTLEVKDMQAMVWETVRVPKESGRGMKYQRTPTIHFPFTPDGQQGDSVALNAGGQDDMMVWLGKP